MWWCFKLKDLADQLFDEGEIGALFLRFIKPSKEVEVVNGLRRNRQCFSPLECDNSCQIVKSNLAII